MLLDLDGHAEESRRANLVRWVLAALDLLRLCVLELALELVQRNV